MTANPFRMWPSSRRSRSISKPGNTTSLIFSPSPMSAPSSIPRRWLARFRSIDAGHRPRHWPEVGLRSSLRANDLIAFLSHQASDDTGYARQHAVAALDIPDPETPVGARGIGEPPVGGGCAAILNALSDALGDEIFRRAPVNLDTILTSLETGKPMQDPLTAHI